MEATFRKHFNCDNDHDAETKEHVESGNFFFGKSDVDTPLCNFASRVWLLYEE